MPLKLSKRVLSFRPAVYALMVSFKLLAHYIIWHGSTVFVFNSSLINFFTRTSLGICTVRRRFVIAAIHLLSHNTKQQTADHAKPHRASHSYTFLAECCTGTCTRFTTFKCH